MPRASVVLRRWLIRLFSAACDSQQQRRRTSAAATPTILWCTIVLLLAVRIDQLRSVNADCWYENSQHEEGVEVQTNEPCLNCTCSRGALLCYLRICPRLPNPPPSGCILLHRFKSCCPELICSDIPSGNSIEGRSEPQSLELTKSSLSPNEGNALKNACILNGSMYAPGSAMDSSSDCEYCYCIRGEQKCVKPKCLLPLDGCVPAYTSHDCCPIHYNCTRDLFTTTTTLAPQEYESQGGCVVDGKFYPEGGKVLGIGHSACDNCYCLRGLVRCEPLLCAAPLLGCTPVIRPGDCCAASYNCSGAIETQPEPNYGQFPTVSKEYAKLRKEVQYKRAPAMKFTEKPPISDEQHPYYVIAESTKDNTSTAALVAPAQPSVTSSKTWKEEEPENHSVFANNFGRNETHPDIYREDALATTIRHKKYTSSQEVKKIQTEINRNVKNTTTTLEITTIAEDIKETELNTTENIISTTTEEISTISSEANPSEWDTTTFVNEIDNESVTEFAVTDTPILQLVDLITVRTVSNSTDCVSETNSTNVVGEIQHRHDLHFDDATDTIAATTEAGTTISDAIELETSTLDYDASTTTEIFTTNEFTTEIPSTVANTESVIAVANSKFALETILSMNKSADYDYDYTAPTLPPSLPNLRIIPFVAADALESKSTSSKKSNSYTQEETFPFANRFSPPTETEGGFVPKEPPILINHFYNDYRTMNGESNTVTSLPAIPALTNPPKTDDNNCMVEGKEIKHGESIASEGSCALCVCFYGSIVCHEPQCPIPNGSCRNSNKIDRSTCCPEIICDTNDSPTVVLDRIEITSKPQDQQVTIAAPADPFKDVIKTEPAPDLQLLIGDMSNYLLKKSTTTSMPVTVSTPSTKEVQGTTATSSKEDTDLSFNKLWDILFSSDVLDEKKHVPSTSKPATTTSSPSIHIKTASSNDLAERREGIGDYILSAKRQEHVPGLLKLAGCNIYGRMYRVGRIISELSGPCMECKCTEIGVQCENLSC